MSEPTRWKLTLTFTSDWHIGSGLGRPGNIDRLLARDGEGLPYVPAKSLVGAWRDACERLAYGLDSGDLGGWAALVEQLFGNQPSRSNQPDVTPVAARIGVRPARLPALLRARLSGPGEDKALLRQALTFVKPGVAIDSRSGTAGDDLLRFEEMGRVGTILEADCEVATTDPLALAFLVAGAGLVERLGGKRRRGAGACQLRIDGQELQAAVEQLQDAVAPELAPADHLHGAVSAEAPAAGAWRVVPLRIRLETPVTVADKVVGNVIETLDYIPGTQFLPHVTRALSAPGVDPRPWIGRGDLRVSSATIEIDGQRGRPMPLALVRRKEGKPFEVAGDVGNRFAGDQPAEGPLKQLRDDYLGPGGGTLPRWRKVPKVLGTHNTLDDELQRPTSEIGGLYSQSAIAAGTVLRAELRLRESLAKELPQGWEHRLEGSVRLGRSKKDDYGLATVSLASPSTVEPAAGETKKDDYGLATVSLASQSTVEPAAGETLDVWLLSDTLLRDESLRPDPSAERLRLVLKEKLKVDLTIEQAFVRTHRLDSWQVGWGLPRPSLVGLAAGSCIRFKAVGAITNETLAAVMADGLGERRAEGYGEIALNDPLLRGSLIALQPATASPPPPPDEPRPLSANSMKMVRQIELAAWRAAIARAVLRWAASEARRQQLHWSKHQPPASQLGALRSAVARLTDQDQEPVTAWIAGVKRRTNRSDKWDPKALEAIRKLVTDRRMVWKWLDATLPLLDESHREARRNELWAEAVRSLVDAAVRAEQREREGSPPRPGEPAAREEVGHGA